MDDPTPTRVFPCTETTWVGAEETASFEAIFLLLTETLKTYPELEVRSETRMEDISEVTARDQGEQKGDLELDRGEPKGSHGFERPMELTHPFESITRIL